MNGAAAWLKKRFPVNPELLDVILSEPVPHHLRLWWFCLGGTPAYLFIIQVITGILLTFYYVPNPMHAYDSVQMITNDVAFGWYIRGLHKWSSNLMIITILLHAMRVYFTGAYRKPRELNWIIGSLILFTVLFFGFTGYSLVYEQLSYWGATVAGNLAESVPWVGPYMADFLRGGETLTDNSLTRYYMFHIGVLPTLITILLVLHIIIIRLHGVTEFHIGGAIDEETSAKTFPFFPHHFLTELLIGVVLMVILTCLALIFPAGLGEAANPLVTPAHIKPEWYFFFTFRWLKLTGLTFAVLSLGFAGFLFVMWPFVDQMIRKRRPNSELSVYIGIIVVVSILVLTVWEALATH